MPQKVNVIHLIDLFTQKFIAQVQKNVSTSTSQSNFDSHGDSSVGANGLGLRKSARILSRMSNITQPITHDVTLVSLHITPVSARNSGVTRLGKRNRMCDVVPKLPIPNFFDGVDIAHLPAPFVSTVDRLQPPTFGSHHRSDCLGKIKRHMVDVIALPTLLLPVTGTAIYTSSVDNFDSQPILKSKPSGVWKLFEGIRTVNLGKRTVNLGKRTVNLGKRKRTNVNNFKSHSPLSPQSGPGIFFSLTIT